MKGIKRADQSPFLDIYKGIANLASAPAPPAAAPTENIAEKMASKATGTAVTAFNTASRATTAVKSKITSGIQKANVDRILRRFKEKKDTGAPQ